MLERAEADGTWQIEYDAREGFETEEAHVDFLSNSTRLHLSTEWLITVPRCHIHQCLLGAIARTLASPSSRAVVGGSTVAS